MSESQFTPEDIAALYSEDHTAEEIVSLTGWKLYLVYQTLHELEVDMRPRGHRPYLENPGLEYLHTLQDQGYSQQGMADLLGVSKRTIQRWLEVE